MRRFSAVSLLSVATIAALAATSPLSAQCEFQWDPGFNRGGTGVPTQVEAACVFDAGDGPRLHVGGFFVGANGVRSFSIARFNGEHWEGLGGLLYRDQPRAPGIVYDMVVWDPDGAGPQSPVLVVGGDFNFLVQPADQSIYFATSVAVWDGSTWSPLGQLFAGDWVNEEAASVRALAVYDSGTGPTLYAAGDFETFEGAKDVARWDGTQWISLNGQGQGTGLLTWIEDMEVHDDGSGPQLYIGGEATILGVPDSKCVARWDGEAWSSVGGGRNETIVTCLKSFDPDGPGPAPLSLFAGELNGVVKWDGATWSSVPSPCGGGAPLTLEVFENSLYTAGNANCETDAHGGGRVIMRLVGSQFEPVGERVYGAIADGTPTGQTLVPLLHAYNLGDGPRMFVGGKFRGTAAIPSASMLVWNGTSYSDPLGNPQPGALSENAVSFIWSTEGASISVLDAFDADGSGPQPPSLYAGGSFSLAGSTPVYGIARLDNNGWHDVSGGILGPVVPGEWEKNTEVRAITHMDVAGTPTLFASGRTFAMDGQGVPIGYDSVYKLGSAGWEILGNHADFSSWNIQHLVAADTGNGPELYAMGRFYDVAGQTRKMITRWDGSAWADVGGGLRGAGDQPQLIDSFAAFDDGSDPALFVAGNFNLAGTVPVNRVARWDGSAWSDGSTGLPNYYQIGLFVASGELWSFVEFGPNTARQAQFYKWSSAAASWSLVNTVPESGTGTYYFYPIGVADRGDGPKYYYARRVRILGLWNTYDVFAFDLVAGHALIPGISVPPTTVKRFDLYGEPSLFFAGSTLNRWYCDQPACPADFNNSGGVSVQDIFDFLAAYFQGSPSADINHVGGVTVQDIFDFLVFYFAGC